MVAHPVEQSSASMTVYPNFNDPHEMYHLQRTPIGDPSALQSLDQGASFSSPMGDDADPSGADINGIFQASYVQGDHHQPSIAFGSQEGGTSTLCQDPVDYFTRAMTVAYLELFLGKPTDQQIKLMIDLTRAAVINER